MPTGVMAEDGAGFGAPRNGTACRVDVWIAAHAAQRALRRHSHLLSEAERRYAARITRETTRRSYVAARVLLRQALTAAAGWAIAPQHWRFDYGVHGKPELQPDLPPLFFSVSHHDTVSAVAVCAAHGVGIDIEPLLRPVDRAVMDIALSAGERAALDALPPVQRSRDLIRLWTLKEAYAKLLGLGLAMDFTTLDFALDPARLVGGVAGPATHGGVHFQTATMSCTGAPCHLALAIAASADAAVQLRIAAITGRPRAADDPLEMYFQGRTDHAIDRAGP